jgi:hypothetical protein
MTIAGQGLFIKQISISARPSSTTGDEIFMQLAGAGAPCDVESRIDWAASSMTWKKIPFPGAMSGSTKMTLAHPP